MLHFFLATCVPGGLNYDSHLSCSWCELPLFSKSSVFFRKDRLGSIERFLGKYFLDTVAVTANKSNTSITYTLFNSSRNHLPIQQVEDPAQHVPEKNEMKCTIPIDIQILLPDGRLYLRINSTSKGDKLWNLHSSSKTNLSKDYLGRGGGFLISRNRVTWGAHDGQKLAGFNNARDIPEEGSFLLDHLQPPED